MNGKIALSPDGQRLVMVAVDSIGTRHLWMRPMDAQTAERLSGTDDASYPFWAPDSRQVGFFANAKLKKIDVTGGAALTLCDALDGRGATWNRDGTIVFAPNSSGGLSRVSASGGVPVDVTRTDSLQNQLSHRWPYFLPDGKRFLYLVLAGSLPSSLWVGSLDGSVQRELMRSASDVAYACGHLFFIRENTLMAQRFDAGGANLSADPFPVAEEVSFDANRGKADFSVAENGTLVTAEGDPRSRLVWFDRQGRVLDTLGDLGWYRDCALSPNGKYLAVDLGVASLVGKTDVWVYDLNRRVPTRLTFGPETDDAPVWSPDGSNIYFSSVRGESKRDLYWKPSSGAGEELLLLSSDRDKYPTDCAADGKHLVFFSPQRNGTGDDIWVLPLTEGGMKAASDPIAFLQTEFSEDDARFSPDGRWLAYWSNETGRGEVYVRPFPGPGGKWQISTETGDYPCWRGDGRELFYITDRGVLMAVDVNGTGQSLEAGRPRPLFGLTDARSSAALNSPFHATTDGQRFIVVTGEVGRPLTINVVLNWDAELRTK